jgi:hypothetical protein
MFQTRPLSQNATSRKVAALAQAEAEARRLKLLSLTDRSDVSASGVTPVAPVSLQESIGVSALWLLEWSEANSIGGYAEWYLGSHSIEGQKVVGGVMKTIKGGCSEKCARRGVAKSLEENGLARPLATWTQQVMSWIAKANKTGAAGDLNEPMPAGSSVAHVVANVVAPATSLLPAGTAYGTGVILADPSQAPKGVGRATHTVVHPRSGTWWGLVHALIVHTLGWVSGIPQPSPINLCRSTRGQCLLVG